MKSYYNNIGKKIKAEYDNNIYEEYQYTPTGLISSFRSKTGAVTKYEYDALNRNIKTTDAYNNSCHYTYNNKNLVDSYTDFNGNVYYYNYDLSGNCTKITFPDNTFIEYKYDLRGRNTAVTDQSGNETAFTYDGLDRLIKVTDADENEWTYSYDLQGDLTNVTDPNGNTTQYIYDEYGRLVKTVLPLGMYSVNEYDTDDNLISYTDFNGDKTTYIYDEYGKQTGIKYSQGSNAAYTYDEFGKLTKVDFNGISTQYSYNTVNGLSKVINSDGTYVEYTYDKIGNLTSVTTDFGKTEYTYDLLSRLKTVTDSNGTTTYAYDNNGNLISSVNPIGISQYYSYDNCNRLTEETIKNSEDVVIAKYSYTLDKMGRRIKIAETGLTNRTVNYTYDNLNRLESEEITENNKTTKTEYSFDSANNRLQKVEDGKVTKYTYDANNRLITEGNKTYNYDKNGNTISITENGKTTVYTYFDFGKLKSVDNGSTKETYTYDHQGRRTAKETTINGQTEVTNYLLDDNGLVYNVLAEYDNNINEKTTYTIGNTLISLTTSYYLTDGSGSTRALVNTKGEITGTYTYDAFGNTLTQTGSTYNPYLYNQEQFDQNTGLYYQRARYLNPSIGRFITQDSYSGNIYDPVSLHRYNYANCNPIVFCDPAGYEGTQVEQVTKLTIMEVLLSLGFITYIPNIKISATKPFDFTTVYNLSDYFKSICYNFNVNYSKKTKEKATNKDEKSPKNDEISKNAQNNTPDNNENKKDEPTKKPTSANQMQNQVKKNQAPKQVDRVDKGNPNIKDNQDHIHFGDNYRSLNKDGTWGHSNKKIPQLSDDVKKWITENGWNLPAEDIFK